MLAALRPGSVVSNKYRIGAPLGAGAASVVVEAQHLQNGQHYALKLIDPEVVHMRGGARRLVSEIRLVAQLTSAHAVRVFAVGAIESGEPYIVMEYIAGRHLASILEETGPMWITAAADYVLEACDAVLEAHAAGIIHGGLKLQNLFLAERPDRGRAIKVADFGVGFVARDPRSGGERSAASFVHAAPEQIMGAEIDPRADVWALGVIFYELVAGRPPFSVRRLTELVQSNGRSGAPPPLQSPHGQVPQELVNVVARCLAFEPKRRWRSVADFAAAVAPFASPEKREGWMAMRVARSSLPQQRVSWSDVPTQGRYDDQIDTRLHRSGESLGPPPMPPGHDLLVAEVLPPSHVKNAVIAVIALMILLVVPLMYLHTLAKKTEFARSAQSAAAASDSAPTQAFSFDMRPQATAPTTAPRR
jgi:serine/threonine-protein kinase